MKYGVDMNWRVNTIIFNSDHDLESTQTTLGFCIFILSHSYEHLGEV